MYKYLSIVSCDNESTLVNIYNWRYQNLSYGLGGSKFYFNWCCLLKRRRQKTFEKDELEGTFGNGGFHCDVNSEIQIIYDLQKIHFSIKSVNL